MGDERRTGRVCCLRDLGVAPKFIDIYACLSFGWIILNFNLNNLNFKGAEQMSA